MTIVSVASDIHLEWADCVLPGGEILLLPGDLLIWDEFRPERTDKNAVSNRPVYERFLTEEFRKYDKVLFTPGNHDFWGLYLDTGVSYMRETLARYAPNAQLLDNDWVEIDGVRFIGSTLWATYGCGTANHYFLQKGMKDFTFIKKHGRRFLVSDLEQAHRRAVAFLEEAVSNSGPCVVMTHHAPTYLAINRKHYPDGKWDDAYASNQHRLLLDNPNLKFSFHGHSHYRYRAEIGETKVAANPRGYYGQERSALGFDARELDFRLEDFEYLG